MAYTARSLYMTPYLYTIIGYFVLMFLAKLAFTFLGPERKTRKVFRLNWHINFHQIRESVMSYLF